MRVTVSKSSENAALIAIRNAHFPDGVTELVYDDTVTPIIDTITPYTDDLAEHATLINPRKGYPGQNK